jgi:hypothetical protein
MMVWNAIIINIAQEKEAEALPRFTDYVKDVRFGLVSYCFKYQHPLHIAIS